MGFGATPHRKEARGADEPRLFLEKKEGKKDRPKTMFSAGGIMDFAEVHFCLTGEYEIFRKCISACRGIRDFAEACRLAGGKALS